MGHRENICTLLTKLGELAHDQKDYLQAEVYFQEGFVLAHQMGHREMVNILRTDLATLAHDWRSRDIR